MPKLIYEQPKDFDNTSGLYFSNDIKLILVNSFIQFANDCINNLIFIAFQMIY